MTNDHEGSAATPKELTDLLFSYRPLSDFLIVILLVAYYVNLLFRGGEDGK